MTNSEFETLVRKHQAMVYSIAFHFFRDSGVAEEAAQDVFLQLYLNQGSVTSDSHTVAWLRKTTANRCIDLLRRKKVQSEVQMDELPEIGRDPGAIDPLMKEHLWRLIGSLPEKQRMIMILRYGEDMEVDDIAQAMQMPARTVWSHLQRSIALLKNKASRTPGKENYESVRK
jgi:RNA polymerase sigma-70 factor, ECF subfamily